MIVPGSDPEIVLDLSRLLSRVWHATPTGVDRCEMAYARGLMETIPDRLRFAAVHPSGLYGRLRTDAVRKFLDVTEERWENRGFRSTIEQRAFVFKALGALRPQMIGIDRQRSGRVYLLASPNNLTRARLVRRILQREQAAFVCLVHDLIPLEFPEYARSDGVQKHGQRIQTIADLADGIVTNSQATLDSLRPWLAAAGRTASVAVAHLGTYFEPTPSIRSSESVDRPYFVCIGTIEPRKNHLLLLNIWRRMAEEFGAANIPKLIIIGRRGWENEQVVDMLERCVILQDCVVESGRATDAETRSLMAGARALLLPSFAEGYGMPVTEALSSGLPVLCSDLPALREAGGAVPDYLDALDGKAWLNAIRAYSYGSSRERDGQLSRLKNWVAPSWSDHLDIVLNIARDVAR